MMTRRIETQRPGSRPLPAVLLRTVFRALGPGALCATLAWQVACRGADVSKEPGVSKEHGVSGQQVSGQQVLNSAPAPSATAATAAGSAIGSAHDAPVSLAKYEVPSAARIGDAPAPAAEKPAASASAASVAPMPTADGPAGKSPPGEPVKGPVVTEEPFQAWLQAVSPVAAGGPASVEAVLVANPPYHCNAEYPHKFKLGAAPPGLAYPEPIAKGMQVTPSRSVLKVPVQAQSAGKATVSGTLQFSVCDDERCLVEKKELSLNLEVK
jgi:hypothetical protein